MHKNWNLIRKEDRSNTHGEEHSKFGSFMVRAIVVLFYACFRNWGEPNSCFSSRHPHGSPYLRYGSKQFKKEVPDGEAKSVMLTENHAILRADNNVGQIRFLAFRTTLS